MKLMVGKKGGGIVLDFGDDIRFILYEAEDIEDIWLEVESPPPYSRSILSCVIYKKICIVPKQAG